METSQGAAPPRPAHQLDEKSLERWIRGHDLSAREPLPPGPVTALQFQHGQSNPTYRIAIGGREMVLRKKPPGKLLASAHAVEREFRVLQALASTSVPVPLPIACCEDPAVLGTPFYLMEFVDGRVFVDPNLPSLEPAQRSLVYSNMAQTLAALHHVDVEAVGLQGYGQPERYCARQLSRWSRQYLSSASPPLKEVQQLMDWLGSHIPGSDGAPGRPCVCHGDFRLDNLVLGKELQVLAILDWELSTLGQRWADVAYNCLSYHFPAELHHLLPRLQQPLPQGVPSEQAYLESYCRAAGVALPPPQEWAFYLALSIFRLASILAGVSARAQQGNAAASNAAAVGDSSVVRSLAQRALAIIARSSAPVVTSSSGRSGSAGGSAAGSAKGSRIGGLAALLGDPTERVGQLKRRLVAFLEQHVYPAEEVLDAHASSDKRWTIHPLVEELKDRAKRAGLWNLWLPAELASKLRHLTGSDYDDPGRSAAANALERTVLLGAGLSNLEYAVLCEQMGRCLWAPEVFNCSAPDTGNMEVLAKYGSREQQLRWLLPLLRGDCRSCFAMTEMAVASSDATNIESRIDLQGNEYVVSGVKWWTSGAMDPRCQLCIFMGKTDVSAPPHRQQSMLLVPMDALGVKIIRPLTVYGYDDAPHGHAEVHFNNVRVPSQNIVLGEGRGFEIAQGRLGPGRLHHCMRLIGMGERAIELMGKRALARVAFGRPLAQQGGFQASFARCRLDLDAGRLSVLAAASALDAHGNKGARGAIAAAKVLAPVAALRALDAAVQAYGGAGVCQDTVLARFWAGARTLRIADGPDEVHLGTIAKMELARLSKL